MTHQAREKRRRCVCNQQPHFMPSAPRHRQVLDSSNAAAPCPRTSFPSLPLLCVSRRCFISPQECCNSLPILPNPSASALPHHHRHSPVNATPSRSRPLGGLRLLCSQGNAEFWWRDCWWTPLWCLLWGSSSQEMQLIGVFYQPQDDFTCLPKVMVVKQAEDWKP